MRRERRISSREWRLEQYENSRKSEVSRSSAEFRVHSLRRETTEQHCYGEGFHFDRARAQEWAQWGGVNPMGEPPGEASLRVADHRRPGHAGVIQQDYLKPAGEALGLKGVGWHTFRHTYSSLLDETGAAVGVQQKLMRHANVSTTMNTYGNAAPNAKKTANSKVVLMVLSIPVPSPEFEAGLSLLPEITETEGRGTVGCSAADHVIQPGVYSDTPRR